ncbi:MAG: UDP-N-acetylglucosamine 1-carboxyvinyltransferase [Ruminococcaceae bacterium]|nr:UDP-N-acetylglucosamine 1-carboxyvinyltransferase [Oscillospiraceae bacterium]
MSKLIIEGGSRLSGKIRIPGAKNSILPILAATVISGKKTVLHDCPLIKDVELTLDILRKLGCTVESEGSTVTVDSSGVDSHVIDSTLMEKMRSSIIIAGAIIARMRKAESAYPGGCSLGPRPIDLHIKAFRQMGIEINENYGNLYFNGENLRESDIYLDFPSVGATENIMLAASGLKGKTRIINAAREPEIEDLSAFLNKIGVKVSGSGGSVIEIEGTDEFTDAEHTIIPDRIVAATYMTAAAVTKGDLLLENLCYNHIVPTVSLLERMGAKLLMEGDSSLRIKISKRLNNINVIRTAPHPGFPTDAQSIIMTLSALSSGTGIIIENIFDGRFRHCAELKKMGADISVYGRLAVIRGVMSLYGAKVTAPDLRSGAGLVVAALAAKGQTEVSGVEFVERGYEDIGGALSSLGAKIKKV